MLNRRTIACAAVAALAGSALAAGGASAATKTLNVKGGTVFKPGHSVVDNQRFAPMTITVRRNDTVRVRDRSKSGEPHTISFAKRKQLPRSFGDLGPRGRTGGLLGRLMAAHEAPEGDEPPKVPNVEDFKPAEGRLQVDGPGDSFFWMGKRGPRFEVTAKKGSNLFYFCAIHPWMQGKIQVR